MSTPQPPPLPVTAGAAKEPGDPRALRRLHELATDPSLRQPGWDTYGAAPLDDRAIDAARVFLQHAWAVVPTNEGGINLERHHSGLDLEIEFKADGSLEEPFGIREVDKPQPRAGEDMKAPSESDRHVKVRAYLTDEGFGYEHWRAAQFLAPNVPAARYAILTICENESERDRLLRTLSLPSSDPEHGRQDPQGTAGNVSIGGPPRWFWCEAHGYYAIVPTCPRCQPETIRPSDVEHVEESKTVSASIYWRPLETANAHIDVAAPSSFVLAMTKAFGEAPWRLGLDQCATLTGMAAMCSDGARTNPFEAMMEKIQNNGEPRTIEVWPEY